MSERAAQLVLDLPVASRLGVDDFLVGPANMRAYEMIGRWPDWPDPILRLTGPAGAGKTHLASIFAAQTGARRTLCRDISEAVAASIDPARPLVIDDCDAGPADEAAFFHLLNRLRAGGGGALLVARGAPEHWGPGGLSTPDLVSRLRLSPAVLIEAPDDALFKAILVKLFDDRQLTIDASVIDYLALRLDRSIDVARRVIVDLDRLALRLGRRVSRQLAADVVTEYQGYGDDP